MDTANAQAGPSTTTRKPRGPHPSPTTPRPTARKLRPPPPAPTGPSRGSRRPPPTLPLKVLQGAGVRRTDTQHAGNYSRATVFVTRKTGLAALLARARKLVMDEGYTHVTLYALGAAIPHALLLLHALLDVLPYPLGHNGVWYEIKTDSVDCVDEVAGNDNDVEGGDDDEGEDEFAGLGAIEEAAPQRKVRTKGSISVDIHIAPKKKVKAAQQAVQMSTTRAAAATGGKKRKGEVPKARPSARKRRAIKAAEKDKEKEAGNDGDMASGSGSGAASALAGALSSGSGSGLYAASEEDAMNAVNDDWDEEAMMNA